MSTQMKTPQYHTIRGGGWLFGQDYTRSDYRCYYYQSHYQVSDVSFRTLRRENHKVSLALLGGSWLDNQNLACLTYRDGASPNRQDRGIGFRVLLQETQKTP